MKARRDNRIDLFRGVSLLMIFVVHTKFHYWESFQNARGFSDASEIFVVLAGMSAALAYSGADTLRAVLRPWRRAAHLYLVHLGLFALKAAAAYLLFRVASQYASALDMDIFWADPAGLLPDVLFLTFLPQNLDILPLYVVLLLFVPLILWLCKRWQTPVILLSFGLWLAAGIWRINLPNTAAPFGFWFFNPLSWQILLTAGVIFGLRWKQGQAIMPYNRLAFRAAVLFCVLAVPLAYCAHFGMIATPFGSRYHEIVSKTQLGPLRVLNVLALFYVAWHIPALQRAADHAGLKFLRLAGRHSLPVFSTGIVLSNAISAILDVNPQMPLAVQLCLVVAGCMLQLGFAWCLERRRVTAAHRPSADMRSVDANAMA